MDVALRQLVLASIGDVSQVFDVELDKQLGSLRVCLHANADALLLTHIRRLHDKGPRHRKHRYLLSLADAAPRGRGRTRVEELHHRIALWLGHLRHLLLQYRLVLLVPERPDLLDDVSPCHDALPIESMPQAQQRRRLRMTAREMEVGATIFLKRVRPSHHLLP